MKSKAKLLLTVGCVLLILLILFSLFVLFPGLREAAGVPERIAMAVPFLTLVLYSLICAAIHAVKKRKKSKKS